MGRGRPLSTIKDKSKDISTYEMDKFTTIHKYRFTRPYIMAMRTDLLRRMVSMYLQAKTENSQRKVEELREPYITSKREIRRRVNLDRTIKKAEKNAGKTHNKKLSKT